ncbi:hypothetical protein [Litorivivens sp.]|uniref:hypothetical protein n=1 Tax=Litorivivens sp. TaxID=2020868 RepID=UPI003569CF79
MEEIVAYYHQCLQAGQFAIQNADKGRDSYQLAELERVIINWRNFVKSRVDVVTATGFDTVPQSPVAPLDWVLNDRITSIYSAFEQMKAQVHWLIARDQVGKVTINVSGNNNTVVSGNDNKVG